jgi:hypothetical protein
MRCVEGDVMEDVMEAVRSSRREIGRSSERGITWLDESIEYVQPVVTSEYATRLMYVHLFIRLCPFLVGETGIFRKAVAMHPERLYMPNASCL